MLHEAYAPLLEAGMRFTASHQDSRTTLYRMTRGETILAFDAGQLVGIITLADIAETSGSPFYDRPDVAEFGQFAIRPSHQGTGIGSTLLELVEERARDKGVVDLALNTSEHAAHLIRLYEHKGYRFVEHVQWRDVNYRSMIFAKTVGAPVAAPTERLKECAREWKIAIEKTLTTETSLMGFGHCDAAPVVLKVVRKKGTEEWKSGEILQAFDGHGLVPVLKHKDGAVLLEKLTPGNDLVDLSMNGRDDEATEIIASIIGQMSKVSPAVEPFAALEDLGRDFVRLRHPGYDLIPDHLILKAETIYADLCASQRNVRLLHGDLHHANVLFDSKLGWVAIDPWGALGEIEFEVGASLRNPIGALELLASTDTVERRLTIFERHLKFDRDRALRWAFAMAVLAALWPPEEGVGEDMRGPFITAAKAMLPLIDG